MHNGHLQFALDSITKAKLDRVYFMVERRPRRKQGVKAYEHRQAMVQLAIEDEPMLGSIITEEEQFTAEKTLPLLQKRFGDVQLYLLMGDDMLSHLSDWPHVDDLLKKVCLLVGVRSDLEKAAERIMTIESTRGLNFQYRLFLSPEQSVSSSRVRRQIKAGKIPAEISPRVYNYIQKENLYASEET